jgi:hypothetical protein
MDDHSTYNNAVNEEMMNPGEQYNLPGYDGPVLQSDPPQIRIGGEYVTLVLDERGDWTYPNSGPAAEAFERNQDQAFFEERRRLGTLPQGFDGYGPLSERISARDRAYARSSEGDPASDPAAIRYQEQEQLKAQAYKARADADRAIEEEVYAYPNGGRSLPYVGNSWWQTDEPIFPWNRKDWTEKSSGYAEEIGGLFK